MDVLVAHVLSFFILSSTQQTGSYRISILSLIVFFVLGLTLLTQVDIRRAAEEAGNRAEGV